MGLQFLSWVLAFDNLQYISLYAMGAIHLANDIGSHSFNSFQQRTFEMITETIGKRTVKRFDDINELIVKNFNLFNHYSLYDAEVGHTLEDVARHFQKLDYFLANKKMEEALQARKSQHQAFFHIFQHNNFPALQWAVMIHSIDEQPIKDLSVENLKKIIDDLSENGLTQGKVVADVELAKKKSAHN